METKVFTALNGRNEEVKISAIDELMGMIEVEWKRCRKAKDNLREAEFHAAAFRKDVLESESRLEALGRILIEYQGISTHTPGIPIQSLISTSHSDSFF